MTEDEMAGWHHRLIDMSLSRVQERVNDRGATYAAVHVVTKSRSQLSNCTTTTKKPIISENWCGLHKIPHCI